MNQTLQRRLASALVLVIAVGSAVPASAAPPFLEKLFRSQKSHGRAPNTCVDPAVEELAANLDWLEHNIDNWGSIVAKSPDVWGEARLTKYRQEVEETLAKQRGEFAVTLAGASSTRDIALLAASLQMSFGGNSESGLGSQVNVIDAKLPTLPKVETFGVNSSGGLFEADKLQLEPIIRLDQHRRYLDYLNELRRTNEGDDASDAPGYAINLVRIPVSILPGTHTTHGYGAELTATATMQLDEHLLPSTFRDLVINDLVDQLSLPMTRFLNSDPTRVSQLLATFSVGEDPDSFVKEFNQFVRLYPVLVSDKAIFGAIKGRLEGQKQHSFLTNIGQQPSIFFLDQHASQISLREIHSSELTQLESELAIYRAHVAPLLTALTELQDIWPVDAIDSMPGLCPTPTSLPAKSCQLLQSSIEILLSYGLEINRVTGEIRKATTDSSEHQTSSAHNVETDQHSEQLSGDSPSISIQKWESRPYRALSQVEKFSIFDDGLSTRAVTEGGLSGVTEQFASGRRANVLGNDNPERLLSLTGKLGLDLKSLYSLTALPASLTRRSTLPFPPSELLQIYGERELGRLAVATHNAFRADVLNQQVVHLTDVQAYLREELNSAYQLLSEPALEPLWISEFSNPQLARLIRGHRHDELMIYRHHFLEHLPEWTRIEPLAVLAWCVFVESVLLNEKMNQEIQNSGLVGACQPGSSLDFYGPNPSMEARQTFASYVSARWPLRIFTIDPIANDQNIADTAAIARQMQFAAAFAVASGEMSARAAMNFSRNLQRDFATVALNRTAIGFVHGDNTFGWRFEPRFQTPPVQNNAVVIFRDLIAGGPTDKALRRLRRIEPGLRECVAMILTPSFVSGITIDTRSNWYCLNRPGLSATSMQELTEQSRSIVAMRRAAEQCVSRPDLYRDGEVDRMLRRVEQLDAELPLQTLQCQLPNSNTLGGFELFSSGTRELAPELLGWYGSPGYQPGVDKQVLFLVGDNFSVHQTKVIAGTKELEAKLLSRQIMQVTLPKDVPIVNDARLRDAHNSEYDGYVDAHVATPYGVSGHMLIPALKVKSPEPSPKISLKLVPEESPIEVCMTIKRKDSQYNVVGDLVVSRAPVANINIPVSIDTAQAGLTGSTVDLVLSMSRGSDRLSQAVLTGMPVSNGNLTIGTPELLQAIDAKGAIYASLVPYGLWLANTVINYPSEQNSKLLAEGVSINVDVAVRGGSAGTPVAVGRLPLKLTFLEG